MEPLLRFEPKWFWDGKSDQPHRGMGITVRDGVLADVTALPSRTPFSTRKIDLHGHLLTPGWTNFHTHLELSEIVRSEYRGSFVDWLGKVMATGPKTPEQAAQAALAGGRESLSHGVTHVVDITRHPKQVRRALRELPLQGTSCGEVTGRAHRRSNGIPMRNAALARPSDPRERRLLARGLSPHAPYSTAADWYGTLAADAREEQLTFTTHLAETPEEREFLAHGTGPFRELWERIGGFDPAQFEQFEQGPIHWLDHHGVLQGTSLLAAHVNDATDEELALLARHNVTVVHCPRTHAYFCRMPFDLPRYLSAGLTVKLGTDSCASAPDLNLLADAQLLASRHPQHPAAEILRMLLPMPALTNSFVAWPVVTEDPLRELLTNPNIRPALVYTAGREILPNA